MPVGLATRTNDLAPSATLQVKRQVDALRKAGADLVDFGVGEPDFNTPDHIKHAAQKAIEANFTRYTDERGILELRAAVAEKYRRDYGTSYDPERQVLICCGAKQALYNATLTLFQPGDEVIVAAPYWVSYPEQVRLAGAEPIMLETCAEQGFTLTANEVREALTPRTKAVILNFPNNPSGATIARNELQEIVALAERQNFYLIYDECYEQFVYEEEPLSPAEFDGSRVIIAGSCSKTYAMTGWRLGWAVGPADVIRAMGVIQGQSTSNPNSIAQKAALEALTGDQRCVAEMIEEYRRRRDLMIEGLNAIEGIRCPMPKGSFFAFPNVEGCYRDEIQDSISLAAYLVKEAEVVTIPGAAFGCEGHLRFSYATSQDQIRKGLCRLRDLLG
jgi:aspartate aminotransferase